MADAYTAIKQMVKPSEPAPQEVPGYVDERTRRGRARMRDGASTRTECLKFWRGDQYVYRGDDGILINQNTITLPGGGGKPRHRVRTTRNLIFDIVAHEVSAAISRVPAYEVNPSTSDPKDRAAANLAAKVLRWGWDKWNLRSVAESVITYSVVANEGFAWPYWDSTIGPFVTDPITGEAVGEGELGIRIFGPNEVYWEPGIKFDDSRWCAVEQARPLDEVAQMEGINKAIKLSADASADNDGVKNGRVTQHARLVLVTEYLERPSKKYPEGRWLTMANKKLLRERPFPCRDHEGNVVDEPIIHKLSYVTDPDSDRDQGLVTHLLDAQRTVNDCTNKQLEWKNLAINPQVIIRNGEFKQQLTDEPGAVYHAVGSGEITWRPVPPIPGELAEIKNDAISDMARIAAQNDIPGQVESGRGIEALIEKDQTRRASFIANLAEFHSRFARHCLYLVQRHYTEERLISIQGRRGPARTRSFRGSELRGQMDVTVLPGSIEPRTRGQITQLVLAYADRGWIDPESAMTAIDNGTAEQLMDSIEMDEARANEIIQSIEDETFALQTERPVFPGEDPGFIQDPVYQTDQTGQPVVDPMTGQPVVLQPGIPATTMPGWMPRPFDRIAVHKAIFEDYMKSQTWGLLNDTQKQATMTYYSALLDIEQQQAARAAALQVQQAQDLGMANASRPGQTGMPDQSGAGTTSPNGNPTGQLFAPRYQYGSTQTF